MTDDKRIEWLALVLADHECWEHEGWNGRQQCDHGRMVSAIRFELEHDQPAAAAHWRALRAAIEEVENGEVLGSETRCCVCGRPSTVPGGRYYACPFGLRSDCDRAWVQSGSIEDDSSNDGLIRHILRARKLYRERGKAKVHRYSGDNAPSRHDAESYLRGEHNRTHPAKVLTGGRCHTCKTVLPCSEMTIREIEDLKIGNTVRCPVCRFGETWDRIYSSPTPVADGLSCASLDTRLTVLESILVSQRKPDGSRNVGLAEEVESIIRRLSALESSKCKARRAK